MILQIIKKKIGQLTSVLGEVLLPLCFSFPVTQNTLLVTLLSPNVWGFLQTKQFSTTGAGGSTTQF